jgi:hypothetical protein
MIVFFVCFYMFVNHCANGNEGAKMAGFFNHLGSLNTNKSNLTTQ